MRFRAVEIGGQIMSQRLCKLSRREIKSHLARVERMVIEPKYICTSCARAVNDKNKICKPVALSAWKKQQPVNGVGQASSEFGFIRPKASISHVVKKAKQLKQQRMQQTEQSYLDNLAVDIHPVGQLGVNQVEPLTDSEVVSSHLMDELAVNQVDLKQAKRDLKLHKKQYKQMKNLVKKQQKLAKRQAKLVRKEAKLVSKVNKMNKKENQLQLSLQHINAQVASQTLPALH